MPKFHHVAISVTNADSSIKFYSKLGFEMVLKWESDAHDLAIYNMKLEDFFLELFCYTKYESSTTSDTLDTDLKHVGIRHFALKVESLELTIKDLVDKGMAIYCEIKQGRTGLRYFFITDPDGVFVEFVEDKRDFT